MVITYQGGNYFRVQSGDTTLLLDPTDQRSFRGAHVVLSTLKPGPVAAPEGEEPFFVDHQGEYEAHGIRIGGWSVESEERIERTVYRIELDELALVFLGHLTKDIDTKLYLPLKDADVLIVPAGGKPYISQAAAAKLVRQLEPGIVIPSLAENPDLFLKELGKKEHAKEEKLVVKKKDITPQAMKVVCLTA
jgi:L-ascorbate metabolism protein UlaG (beta-lactamase superfamily)